MDVFHWIRKIQTPNTQETKMQQKLQTSVTRESNFSTRTDAGASESTANAAAGPPSVFAAAARTSGVDFRACQARIALPALLSNRSCGGVVRFVKRAIRAGRGGVVDELGEQGCTSSAHEAAIAIATFRVSLRCDKMWLLLDNLPTVR